MPRSKSASTQVPVRNAPLTALEVQVVVEFVSAAGDTYVDHSCNDFDLPHTPVRRALVQAAIDFVKQEGSDADPLHAQDSVIYFNDDLLMQYLGPRWAALAEQMASGPINPPLCREELDTMASVLEMLATNGYEEYATLKEDADYALPLTPEGQQLAEGALRHVAGDAGKSVKAAEFGYDIHTVKCLKYLAARCRAFAAVSPDQGLAFTEDAVAFPRRADVFIQPGAANAIPALERPGVGPSWLKAWKKHVSDGKYMIDKMGNEVEKLKRYFISSDGPSNTYFPSTSKTPLRSWHRTIYRSSLSNYAANRNGLVEEELLKGKAFPATLWRPLFAAIYLFSFSVFSRELLTRVQHALKEKPVDWSYMFVYYAAMGVVLGFREHALRLARLHLLAHRLEMFASPQYYPAAQTILRIFADYFGEPEITVKGEALTHPAYNALANHWRHADAEALVPVLLAVCDEHTRRNVRAKPYDYAFDFYCFQRTPVEILLVFKLRQALGLANPHLDHPLMNTPLGVLPQDAPFEFDDLIAPVEKSMRQDGFDEEAILADFVAAVDAIN
jgi:hypothetical protein